MVASVTAPDHEQAERIARRYEHDEDAWESALLSRAYLDLAAQLAERERRELETLTHFYRLGSPFTLAVARYCDEVLDRRGGLLGRVRNAALAATHSDSEERS